jgi:hypothetical protein
MTSKQVYDSYSRQNIDGIVNIISTVASASTSTGALIVSGGVGIAKELRAGGGLSVDGPSFISSTLGVRGLYNYASTGTNRTVITTDTNGDLTINADGNDINFHSTDTVRVLNTTPSISTTSGALVVSGGLSTAKDSFIGGGLYVGQTQGPFMIDNGSLSLIGAQIWNGSFLSLNVHESSPLNVLNTTVSTSTDSGALVVSGGLGVANQIHCGNMVKLYNGAHGGEITLNSSGIFEINAGGNTTKILDATVSTSTDSGALVVSGGVGVAKDLYVGGTINNGSSSTSVNFTGPVTLNNTLTIYKIGNLVTISFPETTNTSTSSTYFTGSTVIPSGYRPNKTIRRIIFVTDNNTEIVGSCTIDTSGNVYVYCGSADNFTNSSTVGFSIDVSYTI